MTGSSNRVLPTIAVTGATGYVGGRLAPMLVEQGYPIRCLAREPRKLNDRDWRALPGVEVVRSDLSDPSELAAQLEGCDAAYYLVHSMEAAGEAYANRDLKLAANLAEAAARAGVKRIIYLGGLGETQEDLSEHLRSRREVEQALASTGVPVTVLRAAIIIGSGSASFEILRYLVNRLPVMITPRWVQTECQPIAIADVLHWLVACLATPETTGRVLEIGGPDVVTYRELMQITAGVLGLRRRWIVPVPVLTPRLSSAWISLVTPVTFRIARPLADGLRNRVVVTNDDTQRLMPHDALGVREAITRALSRLKADEVPTHWAVAGPMPGDPDWAGGKEFRDERQIDIHADAEAVFRAVCRIGGGHGWYWGDLLWRLRGLMDQLVGGPGLRRGRRHTEDIGYGEALDFWRVVGVERPRSLDLYAEMKLPGEARLEFAIDPTDEPTRSRLRMTARFRPRGLLGLAYWYTVLPLHHFVFGGMLRGIQRAAEATDSQPANAT
ncbi:SDR family oxidoreductase [Botrimarina colliarenosi]|uniref:SDR family oxidoreductase n=1 Tax=Botrimarina colliarenosi TaxID=2528001 RepID=UPI0011B6C7E9|nr:SDR family oxidoreductase [Botrimarina colliarenosi]